MVLNIVPPDTPCQLSPVSKTNIEIGDKGTFAICFVPNTQILRRAPIEYAAWKWSDLGTLTWEL